LRVFFGYIFLLIFFLWIVDGTLPQIQIALFSGRILIPAIILKITLSFVICAALIVRSLSSRKLIWPGNINISFFLFICYLAVHLFIFLEEYPLNYLLLSYNNYYYFIIIFPLIACLSVNTKTFTKTFIIVSIPILALGFAQYFTSSPVVPVSSSDGSFVVSAWGYYNKVRAFSLFSSGLQFGYFLSLLGALMMFYILKRNGRVRILALLMFTVSTFACYSTLTRNIYIQYFFTVATSILLVLYQKKPSYATTTLLKLIPFLYGLIASLATMVTSIFILPKASTSVYLMDESLYIRLLSWAYYFQLWTGNGLKKLLFGVGLISGSRVFLTEEVVIDNSFLAIAVHIGLVGLLLWLVIMWGFWKWLLDISRIDKNNAAVFAIASYWSTWISGQLFASGLTLYPLLSMMALPLYLAGRSGRSPEYIKTGHGPQMQRLGKPVPAGVTSP